MTAFKSNGSFKTPRTFNLTLTLSGLLAWAIGLVVVLSSFFALGVVVGRSYRPKPVVMVQPVQADPVAEKVIEVPETHANATVASSAADSVLKPEELQYMERLKHKPEPAHAPVTGSKPGDKAHSQAKEPSKDAGKKPEPDKKAPPKEPAAPAKPEKAATAKTEKPTPAKPGTETDPDQQIYNYQYQVASFKKPDEAETMRKRVAKLGLNTAVQSGSDNGQNWHRVLVSFTGKPEDTRGLKDKLSSVGVGKPILVSKRLK